MQSYEIIATIIILIAPATLIYMLVRNARKSDKEVREHFNKKKVK